MFPRLFLLVLLSGVSVAFFFAYWQENSPPEVFITSPNQKTKIGRNALIPYSIKVSDKEDGNSEYEEINNNEVILTVTSFSDSTKATQYIKEDVRDRSSLLSEIARNNCFACHEARSKLIGPSFEDITNKYAKTDKNLKYLAQKITLGTTGTWGDQIMPAQPGIGEDKIMKILDWIFQNSKDPDFTFYSGIDGAFRSKQPTNEKQAKTYYVLHAQYADHGLNSVLSKSKMGSQTIMVLCD